MRAGAGVPPPVVVSTCRTSWSEVRAEVAMLAMVCFRALGVGVLQVLRRLGLREDHRERVPDHVVHVAGQPGLLLAELGDLLGLVALGLGGDLGGAGLVGPRREAEREAGQPGHPQHRHAEDGRA